MQNASTKRVALIAVLGVVFGDIGTSPLYALRECFNPERGAGTDAQSIMGICSTLVWTLIIVVTLKYIVFVLRADNRGEGGVLALVTLLKQRHSAGPKNHVRAMAILSAIGIAGAALVFADGVITPSISILSAIEGLNTVNPGIQPWIVPLAAATLFLLFPLQSRGTEKIGKIFGPVMLVWFATLALIGIVAISSNPLILAAFRPDFALAFLTRNPVVSFAVLGAVFLAVTGAEVLYADIGHFGTSGIRKAWLFFVFPALVLNYLGQGAFLLSNPTLTDNLFFRLVPDWGVIPLVILATAATIIASQAAISGAFSLTQQSVQLGLWPRMRIIHTSADSSGQIYVPLVNTVLMVGTLVLILVFQSSNRLADSYGIAVSAMMFMTTGLLLVAARMLWRFKLVAVILMGLGFGSVDLMFFASNLSKFLSGAWVVVLISIFIVFTMVTWKRGRELHRRQLESLMIDQKSWVESISSIPPPRVAGCAIFLAGNSRWVPTALLHNLKHNKILQETVLLMTVNFSERPSVPEEERVKAEHLGLGVWSVTCLCGYAETADLPRFLMEHQIPGPSFRVDRATWFVGRESLVIGQSRRGMARVAKSLYAFMLNNSGDPSSMFCLPQNRLVILGRASEL